MLEAINVRDYGAMGDGVTDDTAAINAGLRAARKRCPLYFPGGVYLVSREISLTANALMGVRMLHDGQSVIRAAPGFQGDAVLKARNTLVNIEGMRIDCEGNVARGIHLYKTHGARMDNVVAMNANQVCVFLDTCNMMDVGSVKATRHKPQTGSAPGDGFWITNANGSVYGRLSASHLGGSAPVRIQGGPITIDGQVQSEADDPDADTLVYPRFSGGCTVRYMHVERCRNADQAVLLDSLTSNTRIEGGWIEDNDGDGFVLRSTTAAQIYGVRLSSRNCGGEAAFRFWAPGYPVSIKELRMWNCVLRDNRSSGGGGVPGGYSQIVMEGLPRGMMLHDVGAMQQENGTWVSTSNRYGSQTSPSIKGLPIVWEKVPPQDTTA